MSKKKFQQVTRRITCSYQRERQKVEPGGAAVAQWNRLRLPSCRPWLKSQVHRLCFYVEKTK